MKILQVINALSFGGAETMLLEFVTTMNKYDDITVDILILNDDQPSMLNEFRDRNITVHVLNNKSKYSPFILFKLFSYVKRYDIIHAHLFPTNYWIAILKIFMQNKKIILTEHSTNNKRRDYEFFKYLEKFIYSKYNHIITISESVQDNLVNWLNIKNIHKISTIENGINLEKFEHAKSYNKKDFFDTKSSILIMVGRFNIQKDQDTIIKALKDLPTDIKLLLVGDGIRKKELFALTKKLKLEDRVIFLGIRKDIPSLFKTSDIVIVSSNWEGFGLVAVEGMACKKPVIASNVKGLQQVVENHGLIFEKNNEKDLAKKILSLYSNKSYKKIIEQNCFKQSKKYSIDKLVNKYLLLYQKLYIGNINV